MTALFSGGMLFPVCTVGVLGHGLFRGRYYVYILISVTARLNVVLISLQ
jgi:hypothetical protein